MNKKEYEVVHFITDLECFEKVKLDGEDLQALREYLKRCENLQEEYNDLLEIHTIENNDIQELQERIDKVIEYINEHTLFVNGSIIKNILQGEDKDE